MNADEIMQVLRLTAMGRVNTPEQHRFCEALARVFADPMNAEPVVAQEVPDLESPKRARKAKAH